MKENNQIRVPLVEPGVRPELAAIESSILRERGRISLLYQVLLNSPPIAVGWERMLTAVRNQTTIPANLRELIILRVAVLNGANFEFEAHLPHARLAGVTEEKIGAVRQSSTASAFSPVERLILQLTEAMTRDITVPPDLMDEVRQQFDAQGTVELVVTVAAYNMVSRLLVALNIEH